MITHANGNLFFIHIYHNLNIATRRGIFQSIAQQVQKNLAQAYLISYDKEIGGNSRLNSTLLTTGTCLDNLQYMLHRFVQRDYVQAHSLDVNLHTTGIGDIADHKGQFFTATTSLDKEVIKHRSFHC